MPEALSNLEGDSDQLQQQRARQPATMQKTKESNERMRNKLQSKENERKTKCGAGTWCRMMRTGIVAEGEKRNATGCESCQCISHNVCLFEWKIMFCIRCYKTVITEEYDSTKTFEEFFEERTKQP